MHGEDFERKFYLNSFCKTEFGVCVETGCSNQGMCLRGSYSNSPGVTQDDSVYMPEK